MCDLMAAYRSRLASLRENKQCDSVASCKTDLYILPLIQVPSVTTDIIYKDSQRLTVFTLQCRPSWSMCKRNSCINWYFQGLPGPSPPHCTSPPRGYSEPGTRGCPGPRHTGERPGPHPPFLCSIKHFYTAGGVRIQNKSSLPGFLVLPSPGHEAGGKGGAESPNPSGKSGQPNSS